MKKIVSRFVPVLVVIALLAFGPLLSAFAQDGANPLCNGLADADCQLMLAGEASLTGVTSFAVPSYSLDFNFNDGSQTTTLTASGSGEFSLPVNGDVTSMVIHLLIDQVSMSDASGPQAISGLEIIIANSMAYIKYNDEWYGEAMTESDLQSFADMGNVVDLSQLSGGADTGGLGLDLTGVVTTTRGADEDMMGQSMAVFTSNLDIANLITALLSSPMIGQLLGSAMGDTTGTQMTPADMQMLGAMIAPMLGNTSLSCGQWVGVDDMQLHKVALDVVFSLDVSMFSPDTPPMNGELHAAVELGNLNEAVSVTPPESYKPGSELDLSTNSLLGSLGM